MTDDQLAQAAVDLHAAWDGMLTRLQQARDAIDHPDLFAPPPSERVLAEGYRYVLGFLHGAYERAFFEDPAVPTFRRALHPMAKGTIENPDALYLSARIDGDRTHVIRGRVADHRHWQGAPRATDGRLAPAYVILEASRGYAGDTGELAELRSGVRAGTGRIDSTQLRVEPDGTFEIVCAPERPAGHDGNFLCTRRARRDGEVVVATYLTMRELFSDWDREDALELELARMDTGAAPPPALDAPTAAAAMRRMGEIVDHQVRFWNAFYARVCGTYGAVDGDGEPYLPRNDLNDPSGARLRTGGGQSTNVYAGGTYELGVDEALVITVRTPEPPAWMGFHLANLWGESLDYSNHVSSLSGDQSVVDTDGARRHVVAHRDPGVANWIDTTGVPFGYMTQRWTYPAPPDRLPTVDVRLVPFAQVREHLPADVRTVTPDERREQVRARRRHVQRRYRLH